MRPSIFMRRRILERPHPSIARLLLLVTTGLVLGCTTFSFKGSSSKEAPAELKESSQMVAFKGGIFSMGAGMAGPDEFPPHDVELSPFSMDRVEVSNAYYSFCVEKKVCPANALLDDDKPQHPVVGVTHRGARLYCRWLEKRLPSEAEWEFAARMPDLTIYPWGNAFSPMLGNGRGAIDGYESLAPIGSFIKGASAAGLLDVAGNAAEWTSDWYDASYYKRSDAVDPQGPSASTGQRTVRGGSFLDPPDHLRTTARHGVDPNASHSAVGFRCAKSDAKK
ncbi:MAG: formylglycine-generating enzyme family protein [Deltaproteobacteria bacterium]|nr:formylglycine-generating enzyme family protein [Deltaproteobacteria bacterium]